MKLARDIASASSVPEVIGDCLSFELSDTQSLNLILEAIKVNPQNTWVWEARRRILEGLDRDLHKELNSIMPLAEDSTIVNTYHMWKHRSWIADKLENDAIKEEVEFTKKIISENSNNNYAWNNLVFLAKKLQPHGIQEAIEFTGNFLSEDAKNDSAWYYRCHLFLNLGTDSKLNDIEFTRKILRRDAENEGAWNHILALVETLGTDAGYDELNFTKEIIFQRDATNECAWFHRRQIIEMCHEEVKTDIAGEELRFSRDILCADRNNKYAWFHRQWVFQWLGINPESEELELTLDCLLGDANNCYAWLHRQWVLQSCGGWKDELAFCDEVLEDDICNAFAWNQKSFVLMEGGLELSDGTRKLELEYALKAISENPKNQFPWMYLKFLYRDSDFDDSIVESASMCILSGRIDGVEDLCDIEDGRPYVNALDMVLDVISFGYQPSSEMSAMIFELCSSCKLDAVISDLSPSAENSISAFVNCIRSILQYLHRAGTVFLIS